MNWFLTKLLTLPGIVVALSLHEFGHAKVAELCGDDTAYRMGRVSLNPLDHIDPTGMLSLFLIGFGWGRPVVVNPTRFKKPRRDSIFVGLAGVGMNLVTAIVFAVIYRLVIQFGGAKFFFSNVGSIVAAVVQETVVINLSLMLFNLLPIPPLDGFGVLSDLIYLPRRNFNLYLWLRKNGYYILLVCIFLRIPSIVLSGPLDAIYGAVIRLAFIGL